MPISDSARSRSPSTALCLCFASLISLALLLPSQFWYLHMTSPGSSNSCSNAEYCFLGPALNPFPVSRMSLEIFEQGYSEKFYDALISYDDTNHLRRSRKLPSEKLLIASFEGVSAKNFNVTFGSPSRIIRCTMISDLKTIVHVESLNLFCKARKTSATPASPACVATNICSTYLDLGAASYLQAISWIIKVPFE